MVLDDWQRLVIIDGLSLRVDGKWAAREVGLLVPRQQGKGTVLEALELAALFLPEPDGPPPLILHSAHEYKTADEHFRRMRDLIEGSTRLRKQVRIVRTASGAQAIELVSGARLRFVTRTSGSGRGFSPDLVVMDEAYNLSDESMAATMFALSARPNPQLWYTSSAGMPHSEVLARVRKRGLAGGDPRLAFFEWSSPDDADLDDPLAWAQANPALGTIRPNGSGLAFDSVQSERLSMPDEQFARERLGMWASTTAEYVIPLEWWRACIDSQSKFSGPPILAVDVTPDRSRTSIAAAGVRADGSPHVEIVENRPGTGWVSGRLSELKAKHRPKRILVDAAGPGGSLIGEAASVGVEVEPVSTREYAASCGRIFDWVSEKFLWHLDDPLLETALVGATKRTVGDAWLWDRRSALVDISPLVAATLAVGAVGEMADTPASFEWV